MVRHIKKNKIETKKKLKTAILSTDSEDSHKNFLNLAQIIGRLNIKYFTSKDEAIT
jgi:hypothetical protein